METTKPNLSLPRVAVIAVTYRGNELLLVQRANEPQKFGWGFPGGSVNAGEPLHEAACRELLEETQVTAIAEKTFDVIEVNEFDAQGKHHHFVLLAVLCRYVSGHAMAADDAIDCQWMTINQIISQQSLLIPHVAKVAQAAIQLTIN